MADFNAAVTRVSGFFPIFTSTPFTCSGVCVFEIFICSDLTTQQHLKIFHNSCNVKSVIRDFLTIQMSVNLACITVQ